MLSPAVTAPISGIAAPGPVTAFVSGYAAQSPAATSTAPLFTELAQLVTWRTQGLLSDTEFVKAKQRLGL